MRRPAAAVVLLLGLLPLASGCPSSPSPVSLNETRVRYSASDYDSVRERWTRSGRIIKQLDTPLRVHATLLSHDFGVAQAAKLGELFRLSTGERDKLARGFEERARTSYSFFLGAATADYSWNDFERKESVWHLALAGNDGDQVSATEIKAERDNTATITDLFPYVGDFYRAYTVRFPLAFPDGRPLVRPGTQKLTLILAGALGQTELVWRLRQ